ncbi:MAG TPA: hypothetical protein VF077_09420 [Nitrospiraceae bacterium]
MGKAVIGKKTIAAVVESTPKKKLPELVKEAEKLVAAKKTDVLIHNLPLISVLNKSLMSEAKDLLEEGFAINEMVKEYEKRMDEIKARMKEIAVENPQVQEGFKFGSMAIAINTKSRSSLSKDLLLQNGVEPEIINLSMKESTFTEVRFYDVNK